MKEFFVRNKGKVIITILAAICVIAGTAITFVRRAHPAKQESLEGTDLGETTENSDNFSVPVDQPKALVLSDIEGTWFYHNSGAGDVLIFYADGTYSSSVWLGDGTYELSDDSITLRSYSEELTTLLQINIKNGAYQLIHSSDQRVYCRTATEAIENSQSPLQPDDTDLARAALMQILRQGEWTDSTGETILSFTDTEYIATYTGSVTGGKMETQTVTYALGDVTQEDGVYKAVWTCTREALGTSITLDSKVQVEVGENNSYALFSNSFPFARNFFKTAEIVFTQPQNTEPLEKPIEQGTEPQIPTPETQVEPITMEQLLGTWIGTLSDVQWQFVFNADGSYTFTCGTYTETGTFSISEYGKGIFHSALNLTLNGETRSIDFYLRSNGRFLVLYADHPVYERQGV